MPKTEADWQAESDADTLIRSQEIKNDKKRMKAALKILKEKKSALNKLT